MFHVKSYAVLPVFHFSIAVLSHIASSTPDPTAVRREGAGFFLVTYPGIHKRPVVATARLPRVSRCPG